MAFQKDRTTKASKSRLWSVWQKFLSTKLSTNALLLVALALCGLGMLDFIACWGGFIDTVVSLKVLLDACCAPVSGGHVFAANIAASQSSVVLGGKIPHKGPRQTSHRSRRFYKVMNCKKDQAFSWPLLCLAEDLVKHKTHAENGTSI